MVKQRHEHDLSIANFASQGMNEQDRENVSCFYKLIVLCINRVDV